MNEKKNDEELQSRRSFFKNAAKGVLPILGAVVLANIPLNSNAGNVESSSGCNGCVGKCMASCKGSCYGECKGSCKDTCDGGCKTSCRGTCKGSCKKSAY